MALSDPRIIFSIHSMTVKNRATGLPYGTLEVLGDAALNFPAETAKLFGGSSKFPWAAEVTQIDSTITVEARALPDFAFELYMGASVSTTAADASGTVSALSNDVGTSVFDAATGIATATLKTNEEGNMKFGRYIVRAVSATTVDVYATTSVQFLRGTDLDYVDDTLKITSSALTIATATAVEIPNTGIELTGGSGTIGMTTDDVAYFDVVPPHSGISDITIGQKGISFPEHEVIILAEERSNGDLFEIIGYKATATAGMVIPLEQGGFSMPNLETTLLYDSSKGSIGRIRTAAQTL
jgi:hypothetical protein